MVPPRAAERAWLGEQALDLAAGATPRQRARPRTRAARGRARPRAGTASTRFTGSRSRAISFASGTRACARSAASGWKRSGSPRQPASRAGGAETGLDTITAPPVPVEEADLLPGRPGDPGMPAQVGVQRGRAGLLGPEHEKVGSGRQRGRAAVRPDRVRATLRTGSGIRGSPPPAGGAFRNPRPAIRGRTRGHTNIDPPPGHPRCPDVTLPNTGHVWVTTLYRIGSDPFELSHAAPQNVECKDFAASH